MSRGRSTDVVDKELEGVADVGLEEGVDIGLEGGVDVRLEGGVDVRLEGGVDVQREGGIAEAEVVMEQVVKGTCEHTYTGSDNFGRSMEERGK